MLFRLAVEKSDVILELDRLKEYVHSAQQTMRRKDDIISNLSSCVCRQRGRVELARMFFTWREQHVDAKREVGNRIAVDHAGGSQCILLKDRGVSCWRIAVDHVDGLYWILLTDRGDRRNAGIPPVIVIVIIVIVWYRVALLSLSGAVWHNFPALVSRGIIFSVAMWHNFFWVRFRSFNTATLIPPGQSSRLFVATCPHVILSAVSLLPPVHMSSYQPSLCCHLSTCHPISRLFVATCPHVILSAVSLLPPVHMSSYQPSLCCHLSTCHPISRLFVATCPHVILSAVSLLPPVHMSSYQRDPVISLSAAPLSGQRPITRKVTEIKNLLIQEIGL